MKVKELLELIAYKKWGEDEELCVLIYDKAMFDYPEDDEMVLTNEGWAKVVKDFEEHDEHVGFPDLGESIGMAVVDYAELREEETVSE
jgi:hypothetical protein